jgi:hypothetical protein
MAARKIERTRQFFARAFDFGYTRSLEETFSRWPRKVLQEDAVRAVRRFKPQIIVAIFPTDARAGHGQHQASAVIATDVMELAGPADRYPEMTSHGLPPWKPLALYRLMWWKPEAGELEVALDPVEPIGGKSILQLAGASRSMHRSQDMGQLQELGPRTAKLSWLAGDVSEGKSGLFEGIDTSLAGIAGVLRGGSFRSEVEVHLQRLEVQARERRFQLSPANLEDAAIELAQMAKDLEKIQRALARSPDPAATVVSQLIEEKLSAAERGMAAAAGIFFEATAEREIVVPSEEFRVEASLWSTGRARVKVVGANIVSPAGWRGEAQSTDPTDATEDSFKKWEFTISVPVGSRPTSPSFLNLAAGGDLYDWSEIPVHRLGAPLDLPPLSVEFDLEIEGWPLTISREVVYRYGDQAFGEIRRPLRAVPALEVSVEPALTLWSIGDTKSSELEVILRSNRQGSLEGTVQIEMPANWAPVEPLPFHIDESRGTVALQIPLDAPDKLSTSTFWGSVVATTPEGGRFAFSVPVVDYEHIRPAPRLEKAVFEVRSFELALPALKRVGYIRGAADRSPEVLLRLGFPVEILSREDLVTGDLSGFDAIVVGPRAYEVDRTLAATNHRLVDFARGGGLLLVQYQQYQFVREGYAPFSLTIAQPHDRITDESSAVRILAADHSVFKTPNRIGDADWEGWIHERGLYLAHSWAREYEPLLAMQDPTMDEQSGGLLVAPLGEGTYVYTGLSFFRQLPAGVPGALRLMSNLLALAEEVTN